MKKAHIEKYQLWIQGSLLRRTAGAEASTPLPQQGSSFASLQMFDEERLQFPASAMIPSNTVKLIT